MAGDGLSRGSGESASLPTEVKKVLAMFAAPHLTKSDTAGEVKYAQLMFGKPVKTECVRVLAVAKMTSPLVSKATKSQEVVTRFDRVTFMSPENRGA